jgi:hypothetical protein
MRCKILAALFFLLTLNSLAQKLEIYQPPTLAQSSVGYNDLFGSGTDGVYLLSEPHVSGITVLYPWGGSPTQGVDTSSTGPCTEGAGPNQCLWGNVDPILEGYINGTNAGHTNGLAGHNQKINLIIEMVPESGNSSDSTLVPPYVYLPSSYTNSNWCVINGQTCAAQDQVTCGTATSGWPGDASAPTCSGALPFPQGQPSQCSSPQAGVWNYNQCHLTGNNSNNGLSCGSTGPYQDVSGYPVLYEQPLMTAYEKYIDTVLKHYSPQGSAYNTIGQYIGYIRIGLASGGENLPICTTTGSGNNTKGVWPSPQGLTYDLGSNGATSPDWFATTPTCPGGSNDEAACRGKYAYLTGSPNGATIDGTGYIQTIFPAFKASLAQYESTSPLYYKPFIMASAHSGPPGSAPDISYADTEAPIFINWPCGSCEESGFGDPSLNEYDLLDNDPNQRCINDWCDLFGMYNHLGGNLYLQTETPNPFVTVQISGISAATQQVTCATNCTSAASFTGSAFKGLENQEGFAVAGATPGQKYMFKIAMNGVGNDGKTFTLDSSTPFNTQNITFPTTLYVGDYLPDTTPFAQVHFANTIEVYFCDWEFAYNFPGDGSLGCQNQTFNTASQSAAYATILGNP